MSVARLFSSVAHPFSSTARGRSPAGVALVALVLVGLVSLGAACSETTNTGRTGTSSSNDNNGDGLDAGDSDDHDDNNGHNNGGADTGDDGDEADSGEERGELPPPEEDPRCEDNDGDGYFANCPGGTDCHDADPNVHPGAEEICGDNLDNDCSGGPDNGCDCAEDDRPCYTGPAGTVGRGSCSAGIQHCENGVWGECEEQVLPQGELCNGEDDSCDGEIDEGVSNACGGCGEVDAEEVCGDGIDNDCDGRVDEGCTCGISSDCYAGPPDTRGVGACSDGTRECDGEVWGECVNSVTPVAETCGDGIDNDCDGEVDEGCGCLPVDEICDGVDNDCDGEVDEGCTPCLGGTDQVTPWQMHHGLGPQCFDETFDEHGQPEEYEYASIPPKDDADWEPEPDNFISFDERSTMCGEDGEPDLCACRAGGDFTYFQTFFNIPSTLQIDSLQVEITNVDDGARVTIFNSDHPQGIVDPNSYAYFPGNSTAELAQYITTGLNRVVITHVDDCCSERRIEGVHVSVNGEEITQCEEE